MTHAPPHPSSAQPSPSNSQCPLAPLRLILSLPHLMCPMDHNPSQPTPHLALVPDPHPFPFSFLNLLTRPSMRSTYRLLTASNPRFDPPSQPSPPLSTSAEVPNTSRRALPEPADPFDPPGPTDHLTYGTKARYPQPDPLPPLFSGPNKPRLIHVSLIARHGTRNPTNNSLTRMTALHTWLHSALPHNPAWLRSWSAILAEYRRAPGALTGHGVLDLHNIALRFARLYAPALSENHRPTLRIRSSYKARAVASAQAFLDGYLDACHKHDLPEPLLVLQPTPEAGCKAKLAQCPPRPPSPTQSSVSSTDFDFEESEFFGRVSLEDDARVQVLPLGRDAVLRYFERNAEYANFAMRHKALTRTDLSRGVLRRHGAALAARLAAALGATVPMDSELVRAVAEAAAFDAAHGRADSSVFCRALTVRDSWILELFERRHRPFFKAHERFRTVSAPLVEDLVESLKASVGLPGAERPVSADLRFAHAETLIPFLLLLGIHTNGMHPNDPEYRRGLGAMSPFAANLALELYETTPPCGGKTHFVRFRLHERYVECIPALGERGKTGVVQLDHLLEFFESVLDEAVPGPNEKMRTES